MNTNSSGKTYKIGQAANLLEVETYVLRFWENEFSQLSPIRTSKGQRLYTEDHLALIRRIKHLLYDQGLTIEGAKRKLEEDDNWWNLLNDIKKDLREIKNLLLSS